MRRDLDAARERHIAREMRQELQDTAHTVWGWMDQFTSDTSDEKRNAPNQLEPDGS